MFGPYNIVTVENQVKILMWSEFTLFYKFQANAPSFFYMMFMKGIISSCVNCDNPNFCLPTLSHSNIQSAPAVSSDKEGMALCVALCLISTIQLGIPNCEIYNTTTLQIWQTSMYKKKLYCKVQHSYKTLISTIIKR